MEVNTWTAYPVDNHSQPHLPIEEYAANSRPVKLILEIHLAGFGARIVPQAFAQETALLGLEKTRRLGAVRKQPETSHTDDDSGDSFNVENLAPALLSSDALHLFQSESKEPGECARNGGGTWGKVEIV